MKPIRIAVGVLVVSCALFLSLDGSRSLADDRGDVETAPVPTSGKVGKDCTLEGKKLWGKVKVVKSFPDFEVKVVRSFADVHVKRVDSFPDKCGRWKFVDSFPDFTVKFVDSFPDFEIKYVDSFPGVP